MPVDPTTKTPPNSGQPGAPRCPDFPAFFEALWGRDPFPWQTMLAERVARGPWPRALDLPTASGKTACIDIAVWALANQAESHHAERTAPRRIWFVVDRRIVVDEAFQRAKNIGEKLYEAKDGPLGLIADRLRRVAGSDRPLAVARLRGGIFRDDGWARLPSQSAVITSTVDQVGSRLLFRGYGRSQVTAPIFAGLVANDSLVILDEAHCAVPFLQTLSAIETYRGQRWAESPLTSPFAAVVLSATPPPDVGPGAVFPGHDRAQALDHPELERRLTARKPAILVEVPTKGKSDRQDPLIVEAATRAQAYLGLGKRRIAIMANRIQTAFDLHAELKSRLGGSADVVLLTGRMRPYERDCVVAQWQPILAVNSPMDASNPVIVVSTQCLEVGADFSFDALITECASLDALRQRFGRLNRMGTLGTSPAAILVRDRDANPEKAETDAVYGAALATTWKLLEDHAEGGGASSRNVDFGVEALRSKLADVEDLSSCLAPTAAAPMLLPAHLDLLCQTAPTPLPEPDVSLFLHGKDRGAPEVRVVWRADLDLADRGGGAAKGVGDAETERVLLETVALCPPSAGEMLSVPLFRVRAWLARAGSPDEGSDVEGVSIGDDRPSVGEPRRGPVCVLWRGRQAVRDRPETRTRVTTFPGDVMPGDVVIVPASYGVRGLGQPSAIGKGLGDGGVDLWEPAWEAAGRPAAVRVHRAVLKPWLNCQPLSDLVALAEQESFDREEIEQAIDAVLEYQAVPGAAERPPEWWLLLLKDARTGRFEAHPAGGLVLLDAARAPAPDAEPDLFADDDDLTSLSASPASLDEHSVLVRRTVEKLAELCLPEGLRPILREAAYWHDVGKLDERFQILLHGGDELAALSATAPRAKSTSIPTSPGRRRALSEAIRLPERFRHEMLSAQIAARHAPLRDDPEAVDLFLHLVASHHGHARPFAPICEDRTPPQISGHLGETHVELSVEERLSWTPHRIDSGVSERFWRLTRRYGWWGLAYLEAIIRLGDWYASGLSTEKHS